MKNEIGKSVGSIPEQPDGYVMTAADVEALRPFIESAKVPAYKTAATGLQTDHPSQKVGQALIAEAMGISDPQLYSGAIHQLINVTTQGRDTDITALNFAISLVRGIAPRDHLETMLAIQMAAVHIASVKHVRMMNHTESIPQLDIQERVVNKLMRTFTTQMEALRKHRNGGNQKVVVEHVHVHEGGQAIVGNVSHGGRSKTESTMQSHEKQDLPLPVSAALYGHVEENREPLQGASREAEDRMPFPWGKGGRT